MCAIVDKMGEDEMKKSCDEGEKQWCRKLNERYLEYRFGPTKKGIYPRSGFKQ